MRRPHRTFALAPLLLALGGWTAPASAQEPGEEPQQLFSWAMTSADLGTVSLPAGTSSEWHQGPHGIYYRTAPSFTGDPTYEVILRAPNSGHPTRPERLLLQVPTTFYQNSWEDRAVVVGFHSFSVSEKDIFVNTSLPWECSQRGWLLVAPYGITDTNFANGQSQASLEAIGHVLYSLIPFNYRRVYGVGFSMGGLSALSYAMRHLDYRQLQFAGVVVHTAPLDLIRFCKAKPYVASSILSDWLHFQVDWREEPFEYERVSPVQFLDSGLVDPDRAPVVNLLQRPIFLHYNLADPDQDLVQTMSELRSFLVLRGAEVRESIVYDPPAGHRWSTLPLGAALDYVGEHSTPVGPPPPTEMFVDRPGKWEHARVDSLSPETFGRYYLELQPAGASSSNSFALTDTRDLDQIFFRLERLGLDAAEQLHLWHDSADGTADTVILKGYADPPSSIYVNGGAPESAEHDPEERTLTLRPTADGRAARVVITP